MKVYAETHDYGRRVGIVITRPCNSPDSEHLIQTARLPKDKVGNTDLVSIEGQVEWGNPIAESDPFMGCEHVMLPTEEVQVIFDALWKAGIRPTHG